MIKTKIIEQTFDTNHLETALSLGLSPLQARLIANRLYDSEKTIQAPISVSDLEKIVFPKLKNLQHPDELKNAIQAAEHIADAIEKNGKIVLATDYDTDGVTSAWVATHALTHYFNVPKDRIIHMIGQRKNGYGITDAMVDDILAIQSTIDIVISADQGSSDQPRIKRLAEAGINVCITDHHGIAKEGPPESAICTVNPQQDGCQYDKTVAGCFVIFLVMGQVRNELIKRGIIPASTPSLKELSSNVALGTVADSVSLKSPNNRAIVTHGLALINQMTHPSWQAMKQMSDNNQQPFNAEYLGFQVATRINAASRVSDVKTAFHFLNAAHLNDARLLLEQLDHDNQDRRAQQQAMQEQAKNLAEKIYHPEKYSLVIKMTGNAGIQGIIASRVGEQYGVPTIAMTDLEDGTLAGSGRAIITSIDLRSAFQWMSEQHEGLFISMGGHKGAAGCMIPIENHAVFSDLFEQAIKQQLGGKVPVPTVVTDGELADDQLTTTLIEELNLLEPYGREWGQPRFSGEFIIQMVREVGQTKTHLSFKLVSPGGKYLSAIFFNAKQTADEETPYRVGQTILCAYHPSINHFQGRSTLQLRIIAANPI